MDYTELLNHFIEKGMDEQTAGRLAEAIIDAGGADYIKSLLENV